MYGYLRGIATSGADALGLASAINLSGRFTALGGNAFWQLVGALPTRNCETTRVEARVGGGFPLFTLIGDAADAFFPSAGVFGAAFQSAFEFIGGRAFFDIYGLGVIYITQRGGQRHYGNPKIGLGIRVNIADNWRAVHASVTGGGEGTWDLGSGEIKLSAFALFSLGINIRLWWLDFNASWAQSFRAPVERFTGPTLRQLL